MPSNIAHPPSREASNPTVIATGEMPLLFGEAVINFVHNHSCVTEASPKSVTLDTVRDAVRRGPKPGRVPPFRHRSGGCWLWQRARDKDGYGYFRRGGRSVRAHIHYWEERHGPTPSGTELDHTCRNRACVNPAHLEPVTHLENCRRGGLVTTGMTIEKAREVRRLREQKVPYRVIAERFGIGQSLIAQIVTNRCWKEVARG